MRTMSKNALYVWKRIRSPTTGLNTSIKSSYQDTAQLHIRNLKSFAGDLVDRILKCNRNFVVFIKYRQWKEHTAVATFWRWGSQADIAGHLIWMQRDIECVWERVCCCGLRDKKCFFLFKRINSSIRSFDHVVRAVSLSMLLFRSLSVHSDLNCLCNMTALFLFRRIYWQEHKEPIWTTQI